MQKGLAALATLAELTEPEPGQWAGAVRASTTFKLSCSSYSVLGCVLLRMLPVLSHYASPAFVTIAGVLAVVQGFLSYMADVHTYGRRSWWKVADATCATTGMLTATAIPLLSAVGVMRFPPHTMGVWTVCVVASIRTKLRASALLREGRATSVTSAAAAAAACTWMRQHEIWHLLPLALAACLASTSVKCW
jgi:hypothetical protein